MSSSSLVQASDGLQPQRTSYVLEHIPQRARLFAHHCHTLASRVKAHPRRHISATSDCLCNSKVVIVCQGATTCIVQTLVSQPSGLLVASSANTDMYSPRHDALTCRAHVK